MKYQVVKGMSDILPGEIDKWQWVEKRARNFFESRGFREIRTPIVEQTELFTRSIGEASDIVHKEMTKEALPCFVCTLALLLAGKSI